MSMLDEAPAPPTDPKGLTAVGKALAMLDAFDGATVPAGVSELARRARLPKSTAFRVLNDLVEQGYVERRGLGYCLGRRLFELGNQVTWGRPRNLRETALPFLCDLYGLTRRAVHLGVLDGTDVLCIEKLQGHDDRAEPSRVGERVAARSSALGKAILAFSPVEEVVAALAVSPTRPTQYSITSNRLLCEQLEAVRQDRTAYDFEELRLGLTSVAAPILRRGRAVGAISVSGPPGFDADAISRRVRSTAEAIARRLG